MPRKPKPIEEMINFKTLPEVQYKHQNPNFILTQIKIPFHIACIALSGGGKSIFLMNLIRLFSMKEGTFSHIHILHKTEEDLYDFLAKRCKENITFYKKLCDLPEPKDLNNDGGRQLIMFDDCINDKNNSNKNRGLLYLRQENKRWNRL